MSKPGADPASGRAKRPCEGEHIKPGRRPAAIRSHWGHCGSAWPHRAFNAAVRVNKVIARRCFLLQGMSPQLAGIVAKIRSWRIAKLFSTQRESAMR